MPRSTFNPFYVLLVLVGIAFAITASAYGVLTLRGARGLVSSATLEPGSLLALANDYGALALGIEIILLAICTAGAMATDSYWQRTDDASREAPKTDRSDPRPPAG